MNEKKPYTAPQIFRVELKHEQAILSTCSIIAANPMAGGAAVTCRAGGCKSAAPGGMSDNAQRPS